MSFPEESFFSAIGTIMGSVEVVCVIGGTSVLGDVLLDELYWRTTQGRSLHSSLPMPKCNDILVLYIRYDFSQMEQ